MVFINDVEREKWKSNLLHFRAEDESAGSLLGSLKRIKYLGACSVLYEQSEFFVFNTSSACCEDTLF